MRDLFFIVKGKYKRGIEPSFVNHVSGEKNFIGGFDPEGEETAKWYMLLDRETFTCLACGSDLEKVAKGIYENIIRHKTIKGYLKYISRITSDDTYEVRYLGKTPLDSAQRSKKAEGRCPRVSPSMRELYTAIYEEYGLYYSGLIEKYEDMAYEKLESKSLKGRTALIKKSMKSGKGINSKVEEKESPLILKKKKAIKFRKKTL